MFALSSLLILTSVIYLSLNRNNKINCMFALLFTDLAMLITVSAVYASKLAMYSYTNDFDYRLYMFLSKMSFSFFDIVNFYILCLALLMICFLALYGIISSKATYKTFLCSVIPIVFFFALNTSNSGWELYRLGNSLGSIAMRVIKGTIKILPYLNNAVLLYAIAMPVAAVINEYRKTTLIFKKKYYAVVFFAIVVIAISTYAIIFFAFGGYMSFGNRDVMGFPIDHTMPDSYAVCLVLLAFMFFAMIFTALKKPFAQMYVLRYFRRRNARISLGRNFSMILHKYKNAFYTVIHVTEMLGDAFKQHDEIAFNECVALLDKVSHETIADLTEMSRSCGEISLKMQYIDLVLVVRNAVTATRRDGVKIYLNSQTEMSEITGDADNLKEAFINILNNSVSAIRKRYGRGEDGQVDVNIANDDEYVVVKIRDNGTGIRPKELKNIFKPFYTTGKPGENSGVGLKIADDVISRHNGYIYVNSEFGEYTEFTVILPVKDRRKHLWTRKFPG